MKSDREVLERLMCVIDLHIFEKEDRLEINPMFIPVFAEAVQDARDFLSDQPTEEK